MSDAPERIWINNRADQYENPVQDWEPSDNPEDYANYTQYTRTDSIPDTDSTPDPLDDPRVKALVGALTLAANRLHRCSFDYDTGTLKFIEVGEWAQEARAVLAAMKGGGT